MLPSDEKNHFYDMHTTVGIQGSQPNKYSILHLARQKYVDKFQALQIFIWMFNLYLISVFWCKSIPKRLTKGEKLIKWL